MSDTEADEIERDRERCFLQYLVPITGETETERFSLIEFKLWTKTSEFCSFFESEFCQYQ